MILCWFFLGLKLSAAMIGLPLLSFFFLFWHFEARRIYQNTCIHFCNFWQYDWYSLARHWANSLIACACFLGGYFSWSMLRVNSFSNSHWIDSNIRHVNFWGKEFWKVHIIFHGGFFFFSFSMSALYCSDLLRRRALYKNIEKYPNLTWKIYGLLLYKIIV